ncbi:MAG: hypothetical protein WDW38_005578 [Sanguina aurantia]
MGHHRVASVLAGSASARDITKDEYVVTPSGLRILDVRVGEGAVPVDGDTVEVHWAGRTQNYQAKRIDNTSVRDEPYIFKLGSHQAIPAFEEAVASMHVGGIRRLEVLGEIPALSYPRKSSLRFTDELISADLKIYRYRFGPQPHDFDGQRALDFILDNDTLADTNRTLLIDIKLLAVRKGRA